MSQSTEQAKAGTEPDDSVSKVHMNIPQLLYWIIQASITVCLWGRATGKTEGPGVLFTLSNAIAMPRSLGGLVSVTYDKLLTAVLPKLVKGWEKMGYYQDLHFWVRKYAPDELKRPKPYLAPQDPRHIVHWFNGSAQQLISLDRLGISNAFDLDYIYADEAKLFDYEKFKEVLLANRGNKQYFGHLAQHHSILITTDRPTTSKGMWLYEFEKQMDPEAIEMIRSLQFEVMRLEQLLISSKPAVAKKIQKLLQQFAAELNEHRKDAVFISEADTIDNIHALGIDTIKKMKRTLSKLHYDVSVLNKKIMQVEHGFYAMLDEDQHGYFAPSTEYVVEMQHDFRQVPKRDCRWDSDLNMSEQIEIAFDHNAAISSLVVGQEYGYGFKFLNSMYVLHPGYTQDICKKFCEYYKYMDEKVVTYHYDHTSVGQDKPFADEIVEYLTNEGWTVMRNYIGQQPLHEDRYDFWLRIFKREKGFPFFEFNRVTCDPWLVSVQNTGIKISSHAKKQSFMKDKTKETDKKFPQEQAPHLGDAGDTLMWGKYGNVYVNNYGTAMLMHG